MVSQREPQSGEDTTGRSRLLLWVREEGPCLLEVLALAGFAIVQPTLDPLGRSPETFVALHVGAGRLVAFAVAVALVPPLLVWGLAAASRGAGARVRRGFQALVVGSLTAIAALQALVSVTGWRRRYVIALALAAGVGAAFARVRFSWFRSWLRYASPAPVVFAVLFLVASPASSLLDPGSSSRAASGRPQGGAASSSVVLVVFDELSLASILDGSGHIDRERFPNLAAFADGATWYRNATTVSPGTEFSVPSIFTGRYPDADGSRSSFATDPDNLFTLLNASHRVNGHEWITALCPSDVCDNPNDEPASASRLGRLAFDVWRDVTSPASAPEPDDMAAEDLLGDESRKQRFEAFLDSLGRHDRPSLDVLHVALPHADWHLLPSGQEYSTPIHAADFPLMVWPSRDRADANRMRYLLQTQYTDALVGRLVDRLEELGRYDESLIVITADHGLAFREGYMYRQLDEETQADIAWVPLMVKSPHQRTGTVNDDNVLLIDVLPTIAQGLDVEIPWEIDGVPAGERDGDEKRVIANNQMFLSNVRDGVGRLDPAAFEEVLRSGPAGRGDGPLSVWRTGRLGELIGVPVADLPQGPPADEEVTLDVPASLERFDPSAERLDLTVYGRVSPGGEADLVLAVDGVVAAWSETFDILGRPEDVRFLLAAPLLHEGRNQLDVYVVESNDDGFVLRPVRRAIPG